MSTSPADARRKVTQFLSDCPDAAEGAQLLVSELVTNAMVHGGAREVPVTCSRIENEIEVGVGDPSPFTPVLGPNDVTTPGGLGLHIVDAVAATWGSRLDDRGGKSVWFRLPCIPADTSPEPRSAFLPT